MEEGLDVNSTVNNQETLIFGAVRGAQLDTMKYLIDQGADLNTRDAEGNTMLHLTHTSSSLFWIPKLWRVLGLNAHVKYSDGNMELVFADVNDNKEEWPIVFYNH